MFMWVRFGEGEWGQYSDHVYSCCYNRGCRSTSNSPSDGVRAVHVRMSASSIPLLLLLVTAAENPQRRCFCMDVTCDNLLDAVKRTIEEETPGLIKRREAELILKLREVTADEQQLAAKAARSEGQGVYEFSLVTDARYTASY